VCLSLVHGQVHPTQHNGVKFGSESSKQNKDNIMVGEYNMLLESHSSTLDVEILNRQTLLFLSLGRYLYWWSISSEIIISPSSLWFIIYIYYWNLQLLNNIVINKTMVLLSQVQVYLAGRLWLCWLGSLVLLPRKHIWFSNLSMLSVPDEGYSRNLPCTIMWYLRFYL
jgi:hypothetical protein